MESAVVDWPQLESLAETLAAPGQGPGTVPDVQWNSLRQALHRLQKNGEWSEIIRLREIFNDLFARDTAWGIEVLQKLDDAAIKAARQLDEKVELAHLLGARAHNLHRQGYHQRAIEAFEEASRLYAQADEPFESLKNFYMTALCHRALGNRGRAKNVLDHVLNEVDENHTWRGNPLQVMAWISQDEGQLDETEQLLREALQMHRQARGADILVAGALTDLAEVVGLQGRDSEAESLFNESLRILGRHEGQYERQVARTKLKFAELMMRSKQYGRALRLLNDADDKASRYGDYYDLLWRIELTRALIYFRRRELTGAVRKFRLVLKYREELELSNVLLIKQLLTRLAAGTGLPR